MTGPPPHLEAEPGRVVRIFTHDPGNPERDPRYGFASGYRISERLVLTVAHGVTDPALQVDFAADRRLREVSCVWRDDTTDLALLRFDEPPPWPVSPVRLGAVRRDPPRTVSARAIGYPAHLSIEDGGSLWRGRTDENCRIHTDETGRPGTLRVRLGNRPARTPAGDSPWKGMSGAAVVSTASGALLGVFRDHVHAAGTDSHEIACLDVETVRHDARWRELLTGEGIRPDPAQVFPDEWYAAGLLPHWQHMDALAATGQPLVPERMRFVDPGDESSPQLLLARLAQLCDAEESAIGVLLVGMPGTGKTRLCLETATRAERDEPGEWLVVHLTGASLETACLALRGYRGRVLFAVDDIDANASFVDTSEREVIALRRQAESQGLRFAVLATARTRAFLRASNRPSRLWYALRQVEVRADERYHRRIRDQAVSVLAPNAVDQVGRRYVESKCSGLPFFAVHNALSYDRRARSGGDPRTAVPFTDGDIGPWLRDVLGREDLMLPASSWERGHRAGARLAAAARVVAALPLPAEGLPGVLDRRGGAEIPPSRALVDDLCLAGVLTEYRDQIRVVHDLFADQILCEALVAGTPAGVRQDVLDGVLAVGLGGPRVLHNVARALDRLCESLDPKPAEALATAIGRWCASESAPPGPRVVDLIGAALAQDPKGEALHGLLVRPTWQPIVRRFQEHIAGPWLAAHFREPGARDVILAATSCLEPGYAYSYLMGWLAENATRPLAAFAFHRARLPDHLDPTFSEWTTERALEYLGRHALHPDASFVLAQLLGTRERLALPPGHPYAAQVVAWARRWLDRNAAALPRAGFVAGRLVMRPELSGAALAETAGFLLDTVARQPDTASYALEPVLHRHRRYRDLPREVFLRAVRDALAWLEDERGYGDRPEAVHVLQRLIAPHASGRDVPPRVVRLALRWIQLHEAAPDVGRLLRPMLNLARNEGRQWAKLTPEECAELARRAAGWLSTPQSRRFNRIGVLGAVLQTNFLGDGSEQERRLAEEALRLCEEKSAAGDLSPETARDLLPPLLRKKIPQPDFSRRVLDAAFRHVRRYPDDEHTSYSLTALVSRRDLTEDQYRAVIALTLRWLDANPGRESAYRLLVAGLRNHRTEAGDRANLADRAVEILSPRLLETAKGHGLVKELITHHRQIAPGWNRFAGRACQILGEAGLPDHAMVLLRDMLETAAALDPPTLRMLGLTCARWADAHPRSRRTPQLLLRAFTGPGSTAEVRREVTGVVRARLSTQNRENLRGNGELLVALLGGCPPGDTETEADLVDLALTWLDAGAEHPPARSLTRHVARRLLRDAAAGRPRPEAVRRSIGHHDAWLAAALDATPEERSDVTAWRDKLKAALSPSP